MGTSQENKRGPTGRTPENGDPLRPERLDLYYFEECPYCLRVLEDVEHLGLEERVVYHNIRTDPAAREALVELTGKTQVPCMVIDGAPMHESEEIIRFLHRTFGG
jgi:glutathione S-transferase